MWHVRSLYLDMHHELGKYMLLIGFFFPFWNVKDKCKIETKLEQLIMIQSKLYVIHDPIICNAPFGIIDVMEQGCKNVRKKDKAKEEEEKTTMFEH